jgi:hypothetical protein
MERGRFTGQRLANYGQRSGEEVKREVWDFTQKLIRNLIYGCGSEVQIIFNAPKRT